jgi:uncharacterized damage-inducible protein DinB
MARSVGLDGNGNPASQPRKAQTMTTSSTPITGDLAASGQADASTADRERADLLATLAKNRHFLRFTARGLTDEQARQCATVSELCLGGLIKHVTAVEQGWVNFILEGPSAMKDFTAMTEDDYAQRTDQFRLLPGETLAAVLADYAEVAHRTDELVASLPNQKAGHPQPKAPWFQSGESWSARRVLLHIIAETAQHAGHADIIRESLDGAKSMG